MTYKSRCERCHRSLLGGDEAFVCSYDCTWCRECAGGFGMKCPNCDGELTLRPRRNARRTDPGEVAPPRARTQLAVGAPAGPTREEDRGCA